MLERARARAEKLGLLVELRRSDLTRLDWPDNRFDAIVATFVFACIEDHEQAAALSELRRVCKPDGEIRIVDYRLSPRPLVRARQKADVGLAQRDFRRDLYADDREIFRRGGP